MSDILALIRDCHGKIAPYINRTPVLTSGTLNRLIGANIFVKCENFQKVGAFKARGAFNALLNLSDDRMKKGVIAHSSGNHAQAVAYAASVLGVKVTIVMPQNAPVIKKNATIGYGASVVECGNDPLDRKKKTDELIRKYGYTLIHPYDDSNIVHGAATASLELIEDVGRLDMVLTPVGGGGLLSGTALCVKHVLQDAEVYGVEPEKANDAFKSFRDGTKIYPSVHPDTIADGLRTALGKIPFEIIKIHVDDIFLVTESEIIDAMRFLWERMKIVVEPSGAVPVAGLKKLKDSGEMDLNGLNIGVIVSGGNVDLNGYFSLMEMKA